MKITRKEIENLLLEYRNKREELMLEFYDACKNNDKEKGLILLDEIFSTAGEVELLGDLLEKCEQ